VWTALQEAARLSGHFIGNRLNKTKDITGSIIINNMLKRSFSFCSCFLLMLLSMITHAQKENMGQEINQAAKQSQLYVSEKIYVHSDKNFYAAGEIIWFKIYCVDGNDHHPVNISKVAYVELLDRNSKQVLNAKISLTATGGNGSFYLPLTINSDHYTLRAYTNWMKNAGNAIFFEKTISIVNTMKAVAVSSSKSVIKAYIDFFPEGGQLVDGIETKIGFRVTGKDGKGADARGIIIDNTGDTITQFSPYRFGIGHFTFMPAEGKSYKAIVLLSEGNFIEQALPVAKKYGYVMNVTNEEGNKLKVKIRANAQPGQTGEQLFLLVSNGQTVKLSQQKNILYDSELIFYVERSQLGEGLNYLTLFNKERQPVCERLVFNRPASFISAGVSSNKPVYAVRQAVDLSISIKGNTGTDLTNCSVSVYQADSLQDFNGLTIASYLSLISDLKGTIESPAYYFSNEPGVDEATDNLLLTHGWRRFRRNDNAGAPFKFTPEYRSHIITGKVVNVSTGQAVANADCSLSIPSSPFGFYLARSDSSGNVLFETRNYFGPGEVIAQVGGSNKNKYRIDLYSPFSDDPSFSSLPAFALTNKIEDRLLEKSIAMQAQNIYRADDIRKFTVPQLKDTLPFYGNAEFRYLLDDYKRFTTMEEVLREYVTCINVVLRNGQLHMSIFDESLREVYHDNILVLLDGVPLPDYNKIFSYDPLKIKKLEVVPRRYLYGPRYFSGIASFETYDGKFNGFDLDPALIAVDYEGLQLQREFYSPRYDGNTVQNRIPDLRTTLYWYPQLVTDTSKKTNLQFYTSDQKGKFIVVLEGISQKGQPVFAATSFEVE
jgi:hypothetical protein